MNIYVVSMVLTLFAALISRVAKGRRKKKESSFLIFTGGLWGSIMALRGYSVGTDTYNYCRIFQNVIHSNWREIIISQDFRKFPLYIFYNKAIGLVSEDMQWVIITNSLIYVVGILLFIKKESLNPRTSVLYFLFFHFYFYAMNASRQSIAIMFVMWVYHFAKNRKINMATTFLIIAVLTHNIAIIGGIYIVVALVKWTRKKCMLAMGLSVIAMSAVSWLTRIFVKIFPEYYDYISREGVFSIVNMNNSRGARIFISIFVAAVIIYCMYIREKTHKVWEDDQVYYSLVLISAVGILFSFFFRKNDIFARVEYIFSYIWMISLPFLLESYVKKSKRKMIYCISFLYLFVPFYSKLGAYLPYVIR